MNGELSQLPNGFNTYDIFDANTKYMYAIIDFISKKYNFTINDIPFLGVIGLDGIFYELKRKNIKLTVGWDIWSGVFIMSHCLEGNEYIVNVINYLNNNIL